jgi:hypothetical protein
MVKRGRWELGVDVVFLPSARDHPCCRERVARGETRGGPAPQWKLIVIKRAVGRGRMGVGPIESHLRGAAFFELCNKACSGLLFDSSRSEISIDCFGELLAECFGADCYPNLFLLSTLPARWPSGHLRARNQHQRRPRPRSKTWERMLRGSGSRSPNTWLDRLTGD